MNTGEQRLETLFAAAIRLEAGRRKEFLREACAGDSALRAELDSLLAAHGHAVDFLEAPAGAFVEGVLPEAPAIEEGKRVGPYRLIREIGRGGMGEVYLAARADDEYQTQVAIKLVRRGMNIDSVIRRFRHERQILAGLNHPNIARLLDGGATEDNLPWFALEYVEGRPLDVSCDDRRLSIEERLRLFLTVCEAVQHAHRNLVVHRDLKPGNILISKEGAPKLLDFGIAKLLHDGGDESTLSLTLTGTHAMTPAYASPEQAQKGNITTASDVYSLGVILYELLTGHRPYHVTSRMPEQEIARIIREREPVKPSLVFTRRETSGGGTAEPAISPEEIGRLRGETPDRLRRRLAGDLDDIVMMALRKEPDRRYSSVAQFAEDIRLHLAGKPVAAGPETFRYRGVKLLRRHKKRLALAALLFACVTIIVGWKALDASAQRREAEQQRDNALVSYKIFREFLAQANDRGPDVKFADLLGGLGKQVDESPGAPPDLRNEVHFMLGQILLRRGDYLAAEPHVRAVQELSRQFLGETHPRTINSGYHLGLIEWHKGDQEFAVDMIWQAIEMGRLHQPEKSALPWMLLDLGGRLGNQGKVEEAEKLILEARERLLKKEGMDSRYSAANALCLLGNLYLDVGQLNRAEKYYLEFLEQVRQLPDKYQANEAPFRLGVIAHLRGDSRKAEKLIEGAIQQFNQRLDGSHPQVAEFFHYLSSIHCQWKHYQRAEAEARRALEIRRRHHPSSDARTVVAMSQLVHVLISAGQTRKAAPLLREAMDAYQTTPVPSRAKAAGLMGESLTLLKRYDEAERFLTESYMHHFSSCSDECPGKVESRRRLVKLYEKSGKPEQADRFR
jgi:eukaryotic-like serine/threonine-protein kinase